ncbi:MAG: glycosyltransferase [Alphaproteobacteria bacterium]|nr:MAG: glycosyltransferase [Alphaproteobacteria bacterium]
MIAVSSRRVASVPPEQPPLLLIVIDTEEEFDWSAPFDRESRAVRNIFEQVHAQAVFDAHGAVPTYVIDYPVADDVEAAGLLGGWQADGRCLVGAHLHPWVNPPDDEEVSTFNSYPGNLPPDLERAKLARLTERIAGTVGCRPTIYKAGRYGLGPNTAETLVALGYEIDLSVVPSTSFAADGGPDFREYPHDPYWCGPGHRLFEVPLTRGFPGILGDAAPMVHGLVDKALGRRLRLPGILSRLGIVERIALTPEGVTLDENKRLVRYLLGRGRRVFTYAYHSSSLLPGGSPYVRSDADRDRFVADIEGFLAFFLGEVGGQVVTPPELRDMCRAVAP